jgi:hypothetical protein
MRRLMLWLPLACLLLWAGTAMAATGKVVKVLPHFLDLQGRHALSPSLYDRDAYQAQLRQHPEQRSGMRFDLSYKTHGQPAGKLRLQVELRGLAKGDLPQKMTLEIEVRAAGGWFGRWESIPLTGEKYKTIGEVTAWRVTLWDGDQLLGEQKSFLW